VAPVELPVVLRRDLPRQPPVELLDDPSLDLPCLRVQLTLHDGVDLRLHPVCGRDEQRGEAAEEQEAEDGEQGGRGEDRAPGVGGATEGTAALRGVREGRTARAEALGSRGGGRLHHAPHLASRLCGSPVPIHAPLGRDRVARAYGRPVLASLAVLLTAAAAWSWPVQPSDVLRGFRVDPDRFAAGQHRGADLAAPLGAPVHAACGGRVRFAGWVGDAGLVVTVACDRHLATYAHLGALRVRRGAVVARGAPLGTVGRTGRPRGPAHLHLSARVAATGTYVDPLALLRPPAPPPPVATPPAPAGRPARPGPARRPPRLGPALPPARAPSPTLARVPPPARTSAPTVAAGRRTTPAPAPPPRASDPAARRAPEPAPAAQGPEPVPPLAWIGLAAVLAAIPVGALATRAARRHRAAGAQDPLGSLSPAWPSTSRRRSST